jgi:hypothetical protein
VDSESTIGRCTQQANSPADSTEHDEIPGVSQLSLAERDKLTQFLTKTHASGVQFNHVVQYTKSGCKLVLSVWRCSGTTAGARLFGRRLGFPFKNPPLGSEPVPALSSCRMWTVCMINCHADTGPLEPLI